MVILIDGAMAMLRVWVSIDSTFQILTPVKAASVGQFEEEDDPVNGLLESLWKERNHIQVAEEVGNVVGYFVQLIHRSLVVGANSAPNETLADLDYACVRRR